ncbi:MAG: hypothetical protein M0Z66_14880 [Thermaerobacter sp.]|nr:hypothetical protein [Thermaerobacter sp.]
MIDLPILEQIDRMLFAALVGMLVVPAWKLIALLGGRRRLWRMLLEAALLLILSVAGGAALLIGTLGDLRAYVFVGFAAGCGLALALLGLLRMPWQESRKRRRT